MPVSSALVQQLIWIPHTICSSPFEGILFQAAFLVTFFAAIHVGEVVLGSQADASGRALRVGDLKLSDQELMSHIRFSKMDQRGSWQRIVIARAPHSPRPCITMQEYLHIHPQGQAVLLVHEDSSLLTRFQFIAIFRKTVQALGGPVERFTPHTFRKVVAPLAAASGQAQSDIQDIGRWWSRTFKEYIRPFEFEGVQSTQ